jgi:hypothetical protein
VCTAAYAAHTRYAATPCACARLPHEPPGQRCAHGECGRVRVLTCMRATSASASRKAHALKACPDQSATPGGGDEHRAWTRTL